ncbi:hypothetical protein H6H03_39675, partial [Nostoc paludosum FACHB-159]|nr:hypothetical protein [Nostoc paludosum FACHB-159]
MNIHNLPRHYPLHPILHFRRLWWVWIYPSSVTFRVFLIKGLKEKTLEGKQGMDVELQILKHLARDAHPTVAIVDEYCAEYKELFKEVRNYE